MKRLQNTLYIEDLKKIADLPIEWSSLQNKSILITGATGMIGTVLVDVLMWQNRNTSLNCKVYAMGRSLNKMQDRFSTYMEEEMFAYIIGDINQGISLDKIEKIHYMIHAASNTHPVAYATEPISTITTNIIGTLHLLEAAVEKKCERFIFTSTVEVYGENRGDSDAFAEEYCGYIDCNTLRAGYPESKRAGEALCQAYRKEKQLDVVIPRICRVYGPTLLSSDTKALSQFIKKGLARENIILKSEGTQLYSYVYVSDAVAAVLYCMLNGEDGQAYNISDASSDIMLKDLAKLIADYAGTQVVFELPDETEKAGYSKAMKAVLDSTKLKQLGWSPMYDIKEGVYRTMSIMEDMNY